MKRTQIGSATIDTALPYFVLGTPLKYMKQSEVRMYSYLDVLQEEAAQTNIESELNRIYNEMDKFFCIAQIIENLNTDIELTNAFYIYNQAIAAGVFDRTYNDLIERNNEVNKNIINIINDSVNYTVSDTAVINTELWDFWYNNVILCNFYTNPKDGSKCYEKPDTIVSVAGDLDFIGMFKDSAVSFTYTAVDESYISASSIAVIKRKKQNEARNALIACDVQLDSVTQNNYLVSGIAAATGGNAVAFVNRLKQTAKKQKIGSISATVASIIVAAITFLGTLIKAVIDYRRNKLNNEAKNSLNNAKKNAPSESDFFNIDLDGDGRNDLPKIALLAAAGLLMYYLM